MSPLEVV